MLLPASNIDFLCGFKDVHVYSLVKLSGTVGHWEPRISWANSVGDQTAPGGAHSETQELLPPLLLLAQRLLSSSP